MESEDEFINGSGWSSNSPAGKDFEVCLVCRSSVLELSYFPSTHLFHVVFILGRLFQVPHQVLEKSLLKLLLGIRRKNDEELSGGDGWPVKLLCRKCNDLVRKAVDIHELVLDDAEELRQVSGEITGKKKKRLLKVIVMADEDEESDGGRRLVVDSNADDKERGSDSDWRDGGSDVEYTDEEDEESEQQSTVVNENPEPVTKRKRGRPRKSTTGVTKKTKERPGRHRIHPLRVKKTRYLKCPICMKFKCSSAKGDVLCQHLETCTRISTTNMDKMSKEKQVNAKDVFVLICPICELFQCFDTDEGKVRFSEHVGHCDGVLKDSDRTVPLESRIFTCEVCPQKKYLKIEAFLKHFTYHKSYPFKCTYSGCKARTSSPELMAIHWKNQHNADKEHGYKVVTPSSRYEEDHRLPNFAWYCLYCDQAFPNENQRDTHLSSTHVVKTEAIYNCQWCSKGYSVLEELKLHQTIEHFSELNFFKCDQCSEFFLKEKTLQHHIMEKHNRDSVVCDICGVSFSSENQLKRHAKQKHSGQETYKCDECGKSYALKETLNHHKIANHFKPADDTQTNPLECPHCKKIFNSPFNLKIHVETIHENKFRFSCHVCGQGCSSSTNLKRHLANVHKEGSYGKIECSHCSVVFRNRWALKVHLAKLKNEPIVNCKYCGRGFFNNKCLARHLLLHTHPDVKPFACKLCPEKRFRVKEHLMLHWRTHPEPERSYLKSKGIEKSDPN